MKKFLALYMAPAVAREQAMKDMEPEDIKGEMKVWQEWMDNHADSIIEGGDPLGTTKRVDVESVTDIKNEIDGYSIVQAESHDEAMNLFGKDHPHFGVAGAWVEVMEIIPMPVAE